MHGQDQSSRPANCSTKSIWSSSTTSCSTSQGSSPGRCVEPRRDPSRRGARARWGARGCRHLRWTDRPGDRGARTPGRLAGL